jgi:hypothetical protein
MQERGAILIEPSGFLSTPAMSWIYASNAIAS